MVFAKKAAHIRLPSANCFWMRTFNYAKGDNTGYRILNKVIFKMFAICSSVYPQVPPGSDMVPVSPSLPASASRSANTERTSGDSCRMEPSIQFSQKIFIHVLLPIIPLLPGSFVGESQEVVGEGYPQALVALPPGNYKIGISTGSSPPFSVAG